MLASMPAFASRPLSTAAKAGRLELERAGMQMVILAPPAAGLGLSTSFATGAEPDAPGLALAAPDAAGLAEAEAAGLPAAEAAADGLAAVEAGGALAAADG